MSARDPRVDPRPGDVVRKKHRFRTVVSRGDAFSNGDGLKVIYETPGGRSEVLRETTLLLYWQSWCRGAEVVSVAGTEGA